MAVMQRGTTEGRRFGIVEKIWLETVSELGPLEGAGKLRNFFKLIEDMFSVLWWGGVLLVPAGLVLIGWLITRAYFLDGSWNEVNNFALGYLVLLALAFGIMNGANYAVYHPFGDAPYLSDKARDNRNAALLGWISKLILWPLLVVLMISAENHSLSIPFRLALAAAFIVLQYFSIVSPYSNLNCNFRFYKPLKVDVFTLRECAKIMESESKSKKDGQ